MMELWLRITGRRDRVRRGINGDGPTLDRTPQEALLLLEGLVDLNERVARIERNAALDEEESQ